MTINPARNRLVPGQTLVEDPYPFFEALREKCPVKREDHHDVALVTGYEEAVEVLHDAARSPRAPRSPARSPASRCRWRATTSAS